MSDKKIRLLVFDVVISYGLDKSPQDIMFTTLLYLVLLDGSHGIGQP